MLLALGLLASTATQLRFAGPVGPGEVLLAFAVCAMLVLLLVGGRVRIATSVLAFGTFWMTGLAWLAIGWLAGLSLGVSEIEYGRDAVAYLLSAILLVAWALLPGQARLTPHLLGMLTAGAIVLVSGLLVAGVLNGGRLGPVEIWYDGLRFRGWAANPNQMALLLMPLPFVCVERAVEAKRWGPMTAWSLGALASVGLGAATQSDALRLAWSVGSVAIGVALWGRARGRPGRSLLSAAVVRVLLPLVVVAGLSLGGATLAREAQRFGERRFDEGWKGSDRLARWGFGLSVMAQAPLTGLGPGAFAGPTGPLQEEEAHNTPIDWASSTGLPGLLALLCLWLWAGRECLRRRALFHGAAILGLFVFSTFHYVMRQPVFWFYLFVLSTSGSPGWNAHRFRLTSTQSKGRLENA